MDDYIRREDVFSVLCLDCMAAKDCDKKCFYADQLRAIPSTDVRENVHGRWELCEDLPTWYCTNCKRPIPNTSYGDNFPFCPFCGATMI